MSTKDKKDTPAAAGAPAPAKKKSKKKLLIILVGLLVVLGGGGTAGYVMFAPKAETAAPPPEPGEVVVLEAITINLADGHYLKLKLSLQATADVLEPPEGSKALDIAIDLFSNRSVEELSSNEERNRAKDELTEKVSEAYHKEIMDVYFTMFVMQ